MADCPAARITTVHRAGIAVIRGHRRKDTARTGIAGIGRATVVIVAYDRIMVDPG